MKSNYITIKDNPHLIGKRARLKNNPNLLNRDLHLREGVITQLFQIKKGDLDHIGLSLVFDKPLKSGYMDSCITKSVYLLPDSFELI